MTDHLDTSFHDRELGRDSEAAAERRWLAWINAAERLAGRSLDGDRDADGFSLDDAHDAFRARLSAAAYVRSIRPGAAR